MRIILLDMQSRLYAKAIQRILMQDLDNYQIVISESPDRTVQHCKIYSPYALLMEVIGYAPWRMEDRLAIRDRLKQQKPDCKIVILVDDAADKALTEKVKNAKRDGLIDAFLFGSVTESYLVAMMDSL